MRTSRATRAAGIILLEILLAIAIFAMGVLALGRCVQACLDASRLRAEDSRARQLLENRFTEISASPALPERERRRELETGPFAGLTLVESRRALDLKNEKNLPLPGLYEITLRAEWPTGRTTTGSRTTSFYLLRAGT